MDMPDTKIVPREPTDAMLDAGYKYVGINGDTTLSDAWQAMYDAVPARAEPRKSDDSDRYCLRCFQGIKRYEQHDCAAPSPAAEDGLVDLGEPDAWLHEHPDGITTIWCERPADEPPGCLIALYAEPRIDVAYAARIERQAQEIAELKADNQRLAERGQHYRDEWERAVSERDAALRRAEALREALERAKFRMEMEQWNWNSEVSSNEKRAVYKCVVDAIASPAETK